MRHSCKIEEYRYIIQKKKIRSESYLINLNKIWKIQTCYTLDGSWFVPSSWKIKITQYYRSISDEDVKALYMTYKSYVDYLLNMHAYMSAQTAQVFLKLII